MKNFYREETRFGLCGLNCALCVMRLGGNCPGCGGGVGNQPCRIARCAQEHGGVAFCSECEVFPCQHFQQPADCDSFISHRNIRRDLERADAMGLPEYLKQLEERREILERLLAGYNDGRRKTLFCQATNLLELEALRTVMESLPPAGSASIKELAVRTAAALQAAAKSAGVDLKLRRKPRT